MHGLIAKRARMHGLIVCRENQDAWSDSVKVRLLHVCDLHVADVVHIYIYHHPGKHQFSDQQTHPINI